MEKSNVVCVTFTRKDGRVLAEIPVEDAAAFVAGVDSAMRAVSHHTRIPVWRLLLSLNGTAMLADSGKEDSEDDEPKRGAQGAEA